MFPILVLITTIISLKPVSSLTQSNNISRNIIYQQYKYDELINILVDGNTEQIMDFTEDNSMWQGYPTRIHVSTNDTINGEYPLFITATQQKGVSSWELPLVVRTSHGVQQWDDMARTLCPHDAGPNITTVNRPLIHVTTSNPRNVSVGIKLRRVRDFYVELNQEINVTVTPSTPKYFYFSFDKDPLNASHAGVNYRFPKFNYTIPKSVILIIESDDEICSVISIQNNSCPVFDNEQDMLYQGYHLSMTSKGGITLTQDMFPVGFYVVFIVKQNDEECTGVSERDIPAVRPDRVKTFRFRVVGTISYAEYVLAALVAVALVTTVALVVVLMSCACRKPDVTSLEADPSPSTSGVNTVASDLAPIVNRTVDDDSLSESDTEPPQAPLVTPLRLTVAGLSRRVNTHARRSDRYFWSAFTVAIVYSLPVVQLLYTYQQMIFQTGNQDLCYYNSLCAHPLGALSDFNHVYSNVGYLMLGLVFMAQTRARQLACRHTPKDMGISQHHGLLYSMGLGLIMEGALSACYHLCPNKMNFQFDSSFMYVIAVLVCIKLYQSRHPDVNASAHTTFALLAAIMAIGVIGIIFPSVYFWALFTCLHLATCFILTLKIYYVGQFKMERSVCGRAWRALRANGRAALRPHYTARAVLLAIANVANWALAAYGMYEHNKDLARHILAILMGNSILYTLFYVCMKLVAGERLTSRAWVHCALAHVCWLAAGAMFLRTGTKWAETPAHSRRHNYECPSLQFYDFHDLWHLTSAAALFFTFNMLLAIDDGLENTPRHLIPVF